MSRAHALLRAGYPYVKTLGMRRLTTNPVDVALGDGGRLYVLCRGELGTEIRRYTWDDEDLGVIGGAGTADGKFLWPAAMIRDRGERLFVSDEALHRITILDGEGQFLGKWGEQGSGDGQLNRPSGIAFDAEENLYVADTLNHRVQKFTGEGRFLVQWGRFGSGEGEFNMPWGIAVDDAGHVYVSDWRNNRIQAFTADGECLGVFGESGAGEGQLNRPAGLTVDKDGDIYVADWGNNRVQLFNPDGQYVEQFVGDATLSRVARDYMLANPKPLRLREMARLEPQKRLKGPTSVRVDAEGRMYIADHGCHRIQVYQKEAYALGPDEIAPAPRSPTLMTT
jgi:DNA-binding beta-propeller fold protein YncE